MTDDPDLGLRERKKLDTRRALSDAALELAFERGFANVLREDIAARAGVSVRTFNNYFSTKYHAVGYRQVERLHRTIDALRDRPAGEPMWTAITAAVLAPLEAEGVADRPPTLEQLRAVRPMLDAPEAGSALAHGIIDELVAVVAERSGTDPRRDAYPRLVAHLVVAAYHATLEIYAYADPPTALTTLLRSSFAAVAAGLPEPPRG